MLGSGMQRSARLLHYVGKAVHAGQYGRGSLTDGAPPLWVHLARHVQRIRVDNVLVGGGHRQDEAGGRLRCGGRSRGEKGGGGEQQQVEEGSR
jgi:hypothetical protein